MERIGDARLTYHYDNAILNLKWARFKWFVSQGQFGKLPYKRDETHSNHMEQKQPR
jgi:hypothetical protein